MNGANLGNINPQRVLGIEDAKDVIPVDVMWEIYRQHPELLFAESAVVINKVRKVTGELKEAGELLKTAAKMRSLHYEGDL